MFWYSDIREDPHRGHLPSAGTVSLALSDMAIHRAKSVALQVVPATVVPPSRPTRISLRAIRMVAPCLHEHVRQCGRMLLRRYVPPSHAGVIRSTHNVSYRTVAPHSQQAHVSPSPKVASSHSFRALRCLLFPRVGSLPFGMRRLADLHRKHADRNAFREQGSDLVLVGRHVAGIDCHSYGLDHKFFLSSFAMCGNNIHVCPLPNHHRRP